MKEINMPLNMAELTLLAMSLRELRHQQASPSANNKPAEYLAMMQHITALEIKIASNVQSLTELS